MTFGEKLREARTRTGMTQEELAGTLAVSRSAVAKWESDKGMPDISNIKAISKCLNVSIDYLLDDGSPMELSVTRKPIVFEKDPRREKDRVIRAEFPGAVIEKLLAEQQLTKGEKIVDTAVWLLTPLIDVVKLSKQLNNLDNEFYLVTEDGQQYLCRVTSEFLETRRLSSPIEGKRFSIGDYVFRRGAELKS